MITRSITLKERRISDQMPYGGEKEKKIKGE